MMSVDFIMFLFNLADITSRSLILTITAALNPFVVLVIFSETLSTLALKPNVSLFIFSSIAGIALIAFSFMSLKASNLFSNSLIWVPKLSMILSILLALSGIVSILKDMFFKLL